MRLFGTIGDAFAEYEDEHSLVLFVKGCNFHCPRCHNYDTMIHQDVGSFKEMLDKLITPLHTAVVILGGEPMIYNNILEYIIYIKETYGLKVKIYTNGYNYERVKEVLESGFVDAMSIDLKCLNSPYYVIGKEYDDYLENVSKSINETIKHNIPLEIRTTNFKNEIDVEIIKRYVKEKFPNITHIIQEDIYDKIS